MNNNEKKVIGELIGGLGTIPLLLGILTNFGFIPGLLVAMVFWIISGGIISLAKAGDAKSEYKY